MKEMRIGKGCGKSGMKDNPIAMPTKVTVNVRTLSRVGSRARSLASFWVNSCQRRLMPGGR